MTMENQVRKELKEAGYFLVRTGKHNIYSNGNHTITACKTSRDKHSLDIIRGLIRRGKRSKRIQGVKQYEQ